MPGPALHARFQAFGRGGRGSRHRTLAVRTALRAWASLQLPGVPVWPSPWPQGTRARCTNCVVLPSAQQSCMSHFDPDGLWWNPNSAVDLPRTALFANLWRARRGDAPGLSGYASETMLTSERRKRVPTLARKKRGEGFGVERRLLHSLHSKITEYIPPCFAEKQWGGPSLVLQEMQTTLTSF